MSKSFSDGSFELFYRKGWAYLIVRPPYEGGKPVYPEEVEARMRMLDIPKTYSKKIREIIERAEGLPVPLVEWPEGIHLASEIHVEVTEDLMEAWVSIDPPKKGASPPFLEDVVDKLEENGVVYGVDRETIQDMLARREFGKKFLAAEGTLPVHGKTAGIQYHFNINRGKPYLEMDFGRINLKELSFIENKKEGDLLAELLPPIQPVDGRRITGTVIPAESDTAEVQLTGGKNTRIGPDKKKLFAAADGNVRLQGGTIVVEPVVTVKNVDYETGNIHFEGTLVVEGGIADGFIVEADGDIQVGKGVGRAELKAGGNILLKTGINGNNAGNIECGGDLFAKYIESSAVACKGHLIVEEAIMHSDLTVGKHCVLNGKRSEFIAGSLVCGGSFWCKKLGSIYEAPTHIYLGVLPEVVSSYRLGREELGRKQEELNKTDEQIEQLERAMKEGSGDLRIPRAAEQMREKSDKLKNEIEKLRYEVSKSREKLKASKKTILVVEDMMFKGVVVSFGKMEYRAPDNGARKTILRPGESEVIESGFNPYERPKLNFADDFFL